MKNRYLIRYIVVKYTSKSNMQVMDCYAWPHARAVAEMQALASKDFANCAMYGIRRIKIRVPYNHKPYGINLAWYGPTAWKLDDLKAGE